MSGNHRTAKALGRLFTPANLVYVHEAFAAPFLNWILTCDLDDAWRNYYKTLRYTWQRQHEKALRAAETGLRQCTQSSTLHYLLLAKKLSLLEYLRLPGSQTLYQLLRQEYQRIPQRARQIVTSVLLNCHALLQEPLPTTRQWSPLSRREPSDQVFILLGQAREAVCCQELDRGVALFRQCIQLAKTIPHPTGLINALNDLAWHVRGAQPEMALARSQEAMYQTGRFFEDSHRWFFVFDTAAQIEEEQRQPCFLETACLIRDLASELPRNQRDHYAERIAACTLWAIDRSKSRYRCTKELRIALKRRIPSLGIAARASGMEKARLSNLLSGKVAEVKGDTLRKLIHGLAIQPDCRNDPAPLIAEWVKSETHVKAERFLARLAAFHPRRRTWELLALYMGTPARSSRLPGLGRGSRLATFLNRCQQLSPPRSVEEEILLSLGETTPPLMRARIDLAGEFLKRLGGRNRDRFTQFYLTAHEQDRRILDSFVRNYARYSIRWGMQIPLEDGLLSFVRQFDLDAATAAVAFWAFEKKADRLRLMKIASGIFSEDPTPDTMSHHPLLTK